MAALLLSTYWVLLHFEGELLDATLLIFLTIAFLYALCRLAFSTHGSGYWSVDCWAAERRWCVPPS